MEVAGKWQAGVFTGAPFQLILFFNRSIYPACRPHYGAVSLPLPAPTLYQLIKRHVDPPVQKCNDVDLEQGKHRKE